jgi:hypothetical protein
MADVHREGPLAFRFAGYPDSDEMMHNRPRREDPQYAPFQVARATMHSVRALQDNFHAKRAEMKIQDLSGKKWTPSG